MIADAQPPDPRDEAIEDAIFDEDWKTRYGLLDRIQLSQTYHRKRERTLDDVDRFAKLLAVVGSSAAISRLFAGTVPVAMAIAVAATSAFSLVFSMSERARRHAELAKSFARLGAEIVEAGTREFTEMQLNVWEAKLRTIEADEPASLYAVITTCENEMKVARALYDDLIPLRWWEWCFGTFVDFRPSEKTLKLLKERAERRKADAQPNA